MLQRGAGGPGGGRGWKVPAVAICGDPWIEKKRRRWRSMDKEEEEAAVCQGFLRFDQRTKTERASREAVRASRYKQYETLLSRHEDQP
jgi:hypothetical protein